ncbi:unnamed protein product [Strongylus vulgaris]|uniref:Uncharacterized protein n=1 Tax=Strongylus vulgaris TaxID=40348 RepID=A0A3P7J712_STRVU|nr:unnamed protein product [Strongylus vulgaris]
MNSVESRCLTATFPNFGRGAEALRAVVCNPRSFVASSTPLMDVAVLRYLEPSKSGQEEDHLFENRVWIPDPDIGYRLASILDDGLTDVLVGFRDEQGFFEKARDSRTCLAAVLCLYEIKVS